MTVSDILLPYQKRFVAAKEKRRIWISSRQAGKSLATSVLATMKALEKKNGLSLVISTGARAASEFLRKVVQVAEAVKLLSEGQITYQGSADCVKFSTGSRVMSLPSGNPAALRGTTAQCIIIDEAAWIEHLDDVLAAINPTLTRAKDGVLCLVSTPAGKNSLFFDLWQKAQDDDGWFCQTTSIEDAVKDGLDVNIEELRKLCPDPIVWKMEYMAEFADEFGSFIDTSLLEFIEPTDEKPKAIYAGYDVARSADKSAIVSVKQLKDDTFFVSDIVVLSNMKYDEQIQTVKSIYQKEQWSSALVDSVGLGGPIAEQLHDKVSARIKGFSWNESNKTPAYEFLRSLVFDHKLKFAEHLKQQIIADFQNVSRIVTENGKVKFVASHSSQGHSDITSALVLALQAAKQYPMNASSPSPAPFPSAFGSKQWRFRR